MDFGIPKEVLEIPENSKEFLGIPNYNNSGSKNLGISRNV